MFKNAQATLVEELKKIGSGLGQIQHKVTTFTGNALASLFNSKAEMPIQKEPKNTGTISNGSSIVEHPALKDKMNGMPDSPNPNDQVQPNAEAADEFMQKNPQHTFTPQLQPAPQPGMQPAPAPSSVPTPRPGG